MPVWSWNHYDNDRLSIRCPLKLVGIGNFMSHILDLARKIIDIFMDLIVQKNKKKQYKVYREEL